MSDVEKVPTSGRGVSNVLWSEDLAAVPRDDRTWAILNYVALWTRMSVCIPAYMLASGLVAAGMTPRQALGTILLGNLIVVVPVVLTGHAGAKYGIPFAVASRASFGVIGAYVPGVLRALVACGWFGIQCWIGGEALFRGIQIFVPSLGEDAVWWCFAAFWLVSLVAIWRCLKPSEALQRVSAALLLVVGVALLFWTIGRAGGVAVVLAKASHFPTLDGRAGAPNFWAMFLPSLTGVIGFWAAVAISTPDFTRFARSQKAQLVGQAFGLPAAMTLYALIGIAVTAATVSLTPSHFAIWNPMQLLAGIHQPLVAAAGLAAIVFAMLTTSLATTISPSRVFSSLLFDRMSSRMEGLIVGVVGVVGVAWMPWRLMASPESYIHGWLVGCAGLLGPIAGIMIADYFVLRGRSLNLDELYVRGGAYEFADGFNWRALVALTSGLAVVLVGLLVPRLHVLYDAAGFAGSAVAALVYLALTSGPDVGAMIPPNPLLLPMDGFEPETPLA